MTDIKVSVCMVTYNHAGYIAQAVESVLAQRTTFPFEVVVGEDCSSDETRAILAELAARHPERVRLRLAERNEGAKANFLSTVALCRGDYVAMLEGDDYWTDCDKLQRQIDALDERPDWAICFHPTACVYEEGLAGQDVYPLNWTQPEATIEDLLRANFIPTSSVVFRNRLFPAFPYWFRELKLGDWPLHILNAAYGKIGFLPEIMSAYRVHRGGVWTGETPAARAAAIFQMFTAIDHHFGGKYAAAIDEYRVNTVHELIAEVDAGKRSHAALADELAARTNALGQQTFELGQQATALDASTAELSRRVAELDARAAELDERSAKFTELEARCDRLTADYQSLSERFQRLAAENYKLHEFYERWHDSITLRIVRETRRVVLKCRNAVRRGAGKPSSDPSPKKKAA